MKTWNGLLRRENGLLIGRATHIGFGAIRIDPKKIQLRSDTSQARPHPEQAEEWPPPDLARMGDWITFNLAEALPAEQPETYQIDCEGWAFCFTLSPDTGSDPHGYSAIIESKKPLAAADMATGLDAG